MTHDELVRLAKADGHKVERIHSNYAYPCWITSKYTDRLRIVLHEDGTITRWGSILLLTGEEAAADLKLSAMNRGSTTRSATTNEELSKQLEAARTEKTQALRRCRELRHELEERAAEAHAAQRRTSLLAKKIEQAATANAELSERLKALEAASE